MLAQRAATEKHVRARVVVARVRPSRSTALALAVGCLLVSTGCLGVGAPGDTPVPSQNVTVENRWDRPVEFRVTVVREATNETVHDAVHEVPPGGSRIAYDTAEADPEGVETFSVAVTARGTTRRTTVETSACFGRVNAAVSEEGGLGVSYTIC